MAPNFGRRPVRSHALSKHFFFFFYLNMSCHNFWNEPKQSDTDFQQLVENHEGQIQVTEERRKSKRSGGENRNAMYAFTYW